MLVNQPAILSGAFAAEGDKNTIPANNDGLSGLASIAKGFPPITQVPLAQGGQPPQRQDFNGIFNLISKYLLYAQVGGVYEYNNTLDYQPPCIISYNDKFYACKEANGPSTSAGIQSPTVNDYWDEVIIEVATEAEAEAQFEQNNSKIMTPLRVYQAIVAYFKQFLAAAVFTGIVKAVAPAAASNDNSVPTTSWVRTCFESMAKTVAEILEIQWKAEATGYLLLGPYLGNLKILWGAFGTSQQYLTYAIPLESKPYICLCSEHNCEGWDSDNCAVTGANVNTATNTQILIKSRWIVSGTVHDAASSCCYLIIGV